MRTFFQHPYVIHLMSLQLPTEHYAIAGSGPLFARGWISDPGDIDVVARGAAWEMARHLGPTTPAPYCQAQRISLFNGQVEILDSWFPDFWSIDQLIDDADIINDIRFVKLSVVETTKKRLGRPRDINHLEIMRSYRH